MHEQMARLPVCCNTRTNVIAGGLSKGLAERARIMYESGVSVFTSTGDAILPSKGTGVIPLNEFVIHKIPRERGEPMCPFILRAAGKLRGLFADEGRVESNVFSFHGGTRAYNARTEMCSFVTKNCIMIMPRKIFPSSPLAERKSRHLHSGPLRFSTDTS